MVNSLGGPLSRRTFVRLTALAAGASALTGCISTSGAFVFPGMTGTALTGFAEGEIFDADAHYAERPDEPYAVPAVPYDQIEPRFLRQRIPYEGTEVPGTLVVDPNERHLYYVQESGLAIRYGVGVGREGFAWAGFARIGRKAEWPRWTPPAEMIDRRPDLEEFRNGMPPGIDNPLGARAMYLYEGKRDTLFRLHGTNEPMSIGQAVSSGCIRLFNQDIIDLYARAKVNANVVVLPHDGVG
jgi:lipoprotein-anchoring transpeptidase ErfK/SrfK